MSCSVPPMERAAGLADPLLPAGDSAPLALARRPTLLCIDDDPMLLALRYEILASAGYAVIAMSDPLAALRAALSHPPDAVILDYAMPSLSGAQVAAEIRRAGLHLPLVLVSGSLDIPDAHLALFDRFLSRDSQPAMLLNALRDLLGGAPSCRTSAPDPADDPSGRRPAGTQTPSDRRHRGAA